MGFRTVQLKCLTLHRDDNIVIAARDIAVGTRIMIDDDAVLVPTSIPIGHKMARCDMTSGTKIFRYGAPIGSLTAPVMKGEHIHLHNLKSDYIATHNRETVTG